MKRILILFAFVILLSQIITLAAFANELDIDMPEGFGEALQELPSDVSDKLPDDIYSSDAEGVGEVLELIASPKYILDFLGELFGDGIGAAITLCATLCGILAVASICSAIKRSVASEALSGALGFCINAALFAVILDALCRQIEMVSGFFDRINALVYSMIPVFGAVYVSGGSVATATATSGSMYLFLTVSESFCAKTIVPISSICAAIALCRALSPTIDLQSLGNAIKKCYTFALGLIMSLLLLLLASQTALSSAADSIGARAAKMLTASMIPVVGGSVSETLRAAAAGVEYIKTVVGVSGVVLIVILLLPTLVSLLLGRAALLIASAVGGVLGCDDEVKLLGDIGGIYGCMLAAVSMCSVMFILAMNIFIKTSVAIG